MSFSSYLHHQFFNRRRLRAGHYKIPAQQQAVTVSGNTTMQYTLDEHRHRYSVWTASRAVQRSFATTLKISQVINTTDLRQFAESEKNLNDQVEFDNLQKKWCRQIIAEFEKLNI